LLKKLFFIGINVAEHVVQKLNQGKNMPIFKHNKLLALSLLTILTSFKTEAMPSFSRQTGVACTQCHTQSFGPNLTPFGREFKLGGYTMSTGTGTNAKLPPLSGMIAGSFTNTDKRQDPANFRSGYSANNNFTLDEVSLFYAGKIYGKVGAFSQVTYDGYANTFIMDKTDIRFADTTNILDIPLTYGISLNNDPTVQDLWNTTSWGFPYTESAFKPIVGSTALIDGGLSSQVGGTSAYAMINNLVYLEGGAYTAFSNNTQKGMGIPADGRARLDGSAPYWRVALQKDWAGHFFSLGHYGMSASVLPNKLLGLGSSMGSDHYTDLAMDATYQYMANPKHIFEVKTTYIYEDQKLNAQRNIENDPATNHTHLNTYKLNLAYTFDQSYGATFAYNKINGSRGPIFVDGIDNGQTKPNSEFMTAELVYVPFGKSTSYLQPWLNLRTSLQYIHYNQANGTSVQAPYNNTFMVNGWLAF
jgi:hypothetical protein